ncbi:MAG: hypothetical protein ABL901_11090 [Hyphomicrobiaceae bacterium]
MVVSRSRSLVRTLWVPFVIVVGLVPCCAGAQAIGGKQESPDWPCPQRKVMKLGASDLQWQGAPVETAKGWRDDRAVAVLVSTLASRRTPVDDAVKDLKAYSGTVPAAERNAKLTLVFAGLLETVNDYRSTIISGIERFNRRQKIRASEIEQEGQKLSDLQKAAQKDEKAKADYDKAVELYDWNTRVFEERRQNLPLACEIPPAIDGRIFDLAREIQGLMGQPG